LTVSPGSNTLSLFTIDPTGPAKLTLTGKPVSTGGEFPNSVAFSHALHVACVVNTGSKAGISCFSVNHDNTLTRAGAFFELPSINAAQKTTPPTGPPSTGSDVLFNPSSSALFVTVKGDGTSPGYIYAFPVEAGCPVLTKAVVSRPAELMIDFSMSFLSDDRAVISDPTFGAALVDISPSLQVTVSKKVAVPGQKATCWTTFSGRFDAVFLFDGGNPNVTALDPVTGETKYTITGPAEAKGGFDAAVSGEYLYVLQGAAGISVFDLKGSVDNGKVPHLVQSLDLSGLGSRQGWQGLAVYPS
jgi:outer membrane protein assembly factor BamB